MRENDLLTGNRRMKASFLVRCDAEEGGGEAFRAAKSFFLWFSGSVRGGIGVGEWGMRD